jgi:hypothetical protein
MTRGRDILIAIRILDLKKLAIETTRRYAALQAALERAGEVPPPIDDLLKPQK